MPWRVGDLPVPRRQGAFLFGLQQMEFSRVACHSSASTLPTAQTNIITASLTQTHTRTRDS